MSKKLVILVSFLVALSQTRLPQEISKTPTLTAFLEPRESIVRVVALQPDCPLEFVRALLLHGVEGGGFQIYQVRNRGTKPIRSYKIATVTSVGTSASWGDGKLPLQQLLFPGDLRAQRIEDWNINIVPLTDKMKVDFDVKGPLKGIVVFMVVRVELADGTTYTAEAEYEALQAFFEKNQSDLKSK